MREKEAITFWTEKLRDIEKRMNRLQETEYSREKFDKMIKHFNLYESYISFIKKFPLDSILLINEKLIIGFSPTIGRPIMFKSLLLCVLESYNSDGTAMVYNIAWEKKIISDFFLTLITSNRKNLEDLVNNTIKSVEINELPLYIDFKYKTRLFEGYLNGY